MVGSSSFTFELPSSPGYSPENGRHVMFTVTCLFLPFGLSHLTGMTNTLQILSNVALQFKPRTARVVTFNRQLISTLSHTPQQPSFSCLQHAGRRFGGYSFPTDHSPSFGRRVEMLQFKAKLDLHAFTSCIWLLCQFLTFAEETFSTITTSWIFPAGKNY